MVNLEHLRQKATSSNSIPVARVHLTGPEILYLLDKIEELEKGTK